MNQDIAKAIADCGNSDVDILTCVTEALGKGKYEERKKRPCPLA